MSSSESRSARAGTPIRPARCELRPALLEAISQWAAAVALVPPTLWRLAETILGLHPAERHHRVPKDFGWGNRLKALGLAVALRGSRRYCSAIRARQAQIQRPVQTRGPCGGGISRRRPDVGA